MPYLTPDFYFENDFSDYENENLVRVASNFGYTLKNDQRKSFFEGFTPSPEAALRDFEEFQSLTYKLLFRYNIVQFTKEETKRIKELRKTICDTLLQWGEQAITKFGKSSPYDWYYLGFPYIQISSIRRPTIDSHSYLSCEVSKKTKGTVTLSSTYKTKLLTYFHWEISENAGVTWKLVRKTRNSKCQVTRLEPGQTYHFRYYVTNPKGKSYYSNPREVKIPGIAGKPAGTLKKYPANGAVGALLDEYRRAVSDMKEVIRTLKATDLTTIMDHAAKDENCRSIQTILAHVVSAGHNYIVEIRRKMGEELKYYDKELLETPNKYRLALNGMFNYTVQLFEDYPNLALEELDNQQKIMVRWGQLYDVEQLMEHAIVHVLRHRRQVERFLGENGVNSSVQVQLRR